MFVIWDLDDSVLYVVVCRRPKTVTLYIYHRIRKRNTAKEDHPSDRTHWRSSSRESRVAEDVECESTINSKVEVFFVRCSLPEMKFF